MESGGFMVKHPWGVAGEQLQCCKSRGKSGDIGLGGILDAWNRSGDRYHAQAFADRDGVFDAPVVVVTAAAELLIAEVGEINEDEPVMVVVVVVAAAETLVNPLGDGVEVVELAAVVVVVVVVVLVVVVSDSPAFTLALLLHDLATDSKSLQIIKKLYYYK